MNEPAGLLVGEPGSGFWLHRGFCAVWSLCLSWRLFPHWMRYTSDAQRWRSYIRRLRASRYTGEIATLTAKSPGVSGRMIKQEILRLKMTAPGTFHGRSLRLGRARDKRVSTLPAKGTRPDQIFQSLRLDFRRWECDVKKKRKSPHRFPDGGFTQVRLLWARSGHYARKTTPSTQVNPL